MEPIGHLSSSNRSNLLYYDLHIEAALKEFEAIENEIFKSEVVEENIPNILMSETKDASPEDSEETCKCAIPIESQSFMENG